MKLRIKRNNFLFDELIVFLLLYVSNDTLLFGTNSNRFFFWIHVGILLCLFCFLLIRTTKININILVGAIVMVILFVFTQVVNNDGEYIKYVYSIFIIGLTILVISNVDMNDFIRSYQNVMYVIACFSLCIIVAWFLLNPVVKLFPSIVNESGDTFSFLGLGFLYNKSLTSIPRMYGIFREPGVYTCFLLLALIMHLFIEKEKSVKKSLVYACTLFLTFSTAAYIILFLILAVYFGYDFFGKSDNRKKSSLFFCLLMILAIILFTLIGVERIWEIVFKKLYVDNASLDSRLGSVEGNIRIFLENPVLGKGWGYVEDNFATYTAQGFYKGRHNTNTPLKYLAIYGIIPFVLTIYGIFKFFYRTVKIKFLVFLCTMMWIITLCNEDLNTNIVFYLISFYGLEGCYFNRKTKSSINSAKHSLK